jgi:predicted DNA-binding transcriptional regulator YafY
MSDTLLRQWQLLRAIPRAPKKADVATLLKRLESAGHPVTKRTLQRDLVMLSDVFPLQSDGESPGVSRGWSWQADAPAFDLPTMDGPEALTMKLVERFIPNLMPPMFRDYLQPYFRRAENLLALESHADHQRWLNNVRVVPREMPLLAPETDPAVVTVVYQAFLKGHRFTAEYKARSVDGDGPKTYEVNPLGIVARGTLVYLICTLWDYEDVRQLVLHRFNSASLLDKPATRPEGFDIDRYIESGEFQLPVGPMIRLEAIFERGAAAHLYETPLSPDQVIDDVDSERVRVTATVRDSGQLEWWLLGFGRRVEVVGPEGLRERKGR